MEFQTLGQRCTVPFCKQQDYLPYDCKNCNQTHCTTHANDHNCQKANKGDRKVTICPSCSTPIHYTADQDPNEICKIHLQKDCKGPSGTTKKSPNVLRCADEKCPIKLTAINKFTCNNCKLEFCGTHRQVWDHDCGNRSNSNKNKPEQSLYRQDLVKCHLAKCDKKLNEITKYQCEECKIDFCGLHRFKWDHDCKGFKENDMTGNLKKCGVENKQKEKVVSLRLVKASCS